MKTNPISPDDPRLTAYALNELAPAERAEFEQDLAQDPAARQLVAEIAGTAAALTAALEHEPMEPAAPAVPRGPLAKVVRFPYWTISSLAAACFAVFFIYWQQHEGLPGQKQYLEVPLTAPAEKVAPAPAVGLPVASAAADVAAAAQDRAGHDDMKAPAADTLDKKSIEDALKDQGMAEQKARFGIDAGAATLPTTRQAQSAPRSVPPPPELRNAPVAAGRLEDAGGKIVLSPFMVSGASRPAAQHTLAGTRIVTAGVKEKAEAVPAPAGGAANTEAYAFRRDNEYQNAAADPLSTFAVDVDTASYANVRRFLTQGQRPPADAVRIEELVNYFPYAYPPPAAGAPFAASLEVAGAPWAPAHRLVRIGLQAREVSDAARPPANLVFLLDVSGSMDEPNKLPLVKQSLRLLVDRLRPEDRVAIAIYAGASGLALPSTGAAHKAEIMAAIDRLQAEGSTNGALGIQLAYDIAKANFIPGGVNRVILATDGDFNVGVTSEGELVRLVAEKAKSGVFLTVLGFGMGNLKDSTLEQLADKGNGNYAYIDTLAEAKKALVEQAGGTLMTIAQDVKIQVEFNPAVVQAYRLIGYEDRLLAKEDFNNDRVDAGEVGAGHTVTALYEIVPVGAEPPVTGTVDALKYQRAERGAGSGEHGAGGGEMLTVKLRYKEPGGDTSRKVEFVLRDAGAGFAQASQDFKFAAAVAAFGMALREAPPPVALADVIAWARAGLGSDAGGYRAEFISLVGRAQQLEP